MEFTNNGPLVDSVSSGQPENTNHRSASPSSSVNKRLSKGNWSNNKAYRTAQVFLAFCVAIVIVGLLVFLAFNNTSNSSENNYVQTNRLQAVFLNTGQVYFGNIKRLNNDYVVLTNIFYLQTNSNSSSTSTNSSSSNSNTSVSLVKLGCEIHAPLDQMVINRTSITFWENLSANGQVAKAVNTWEKANPSGQKCSDQSTAGTSGQSTPQNATNNSGSTKP